MKVVVQCKIFNVLFTFPNVAREINGFNIKLKVVSEKVIFYVGLIKIVKNRFVLKMAQKANDTNASNLDIKFK